MKYYYKSIILFMSMVVYSQNNLVTIQDKTYSIDEIEKTQNKNLKVLGVDESLNSFIEFELLKNYALELGVEEKQAFLIKYHKSLKAIKDSLYYPLDKLEPILKKNFNRLKFENQVQILSVAPNNIAKVREIIRSGNFDFTKLIEKYSTTQLFKEPTFVRINSLSMEVEEVIDGLKINQISREIKNNENILFVKKNLERKNLGYLQIQQLLNRSEKEINKAYDALKKGKDFNQVVLQFSEERNKEKNYGKVPEIYGGLPMQVYDAVKDLEPKEFSKPFYRDGVYTILYLHSRVPFNDYTKARPTLKEIFINSNEAYKLQDENLRAIQNSEKNKVYNKNIDDILKNANKYMKESSDFKKYDKLIFDINEAKYTQGDFLKELSALEESKRTKEIIEFMIGDRIHEAQIAFYDNTYFFQQDHIAPMVDSTKKLNLIEWVLDDVYKKSFKDEAGMKRYVKDNKKEFTWEKRAVITKYYCDNKDIAENVLRLLENNKSDSFILNEYKDQTNKKGNPLVYLEKGKLAKDAKKYPKEVPFKKGKKLTTIENGRFLVTNITSILPKSLKTIEENKLEIFEFYEPYYYQNLIEKLKKKANIKINPEGVKKLKMKYN